MQEEHTTYITQGKYLHFFYSLVSLITGNDNFYVTGGSVTFVGGNYSLNTFSESKGALYLTTIPFYLSKSLAIKLSGTGAFSASGAMSAKSVSMTNSSSFTIASDFTVTSSFYCNTAKTAIINTGTVIFFLLHTSNRKGKFDLECSYNK